jgi:hypothetical protein
MTVHECSTASPQCSVTGRGFGVVWLDGRNSAFDDDRETGTWAAVRRIRCQLKQMPTPDRSSGVRVLLHDRGGDV